MSKKICNSCAGCNSFYVSANTGKPGCKRKISLVGKISDQPPECYEEDLTGNSLHIYDDSLVTNVYATNEMLLTIREMPGGIFQFTNGTYDENEELVHESHPVIIQRDYVSDLAAVLFEVDKDKATKAVTDSMIYRLTNPDPELLDDIKKAIADKKEHIIREGNEPDDTDLIALLTSAIAEEYSGSKGIAIKAAALYVASALLARQFLKTAA